MGGNHRALIQGPAGLVAAGLLVASIAGPAAADEAVVSSARSTAIVVSVAGNGTDSGAFGASSDGTTTSFTGAQGPAMTVLGEQTLVSAGVLVQDATADAAGGQGRAAACSGLAGPGATDGGVSLAGGDCLRGGQTLSLAAGTLDLSRLQIVQSGLLQGADAQLATALEPVLGQLLPALNDGLSQGLAAFGDVGLFVDLDAVQSACSTGPDGVRGGSTLAGATIVARAQGQEMTLLSLPASPAANTHLATDLGQVSEMLRQTLETTLSTALGGALSDALGPLAAGLDQGVVLDNALSQVGAQLQPLEDNLIDVILNAQTTSAPTQVSVDALDLTVLPAMRQFGVEPLRVQIGRSECGPVGAVAEQAQPVVVKSPPTKKEAAPPTKKPTVPTVVTAGLESAPGPDLAGPAYLAGVLALAAAAGLARRRGPRR